MNDLIELKKWFLERLTAAQKKRVDANSAATWIEHERSEMIKAVREQIEKRGGTFGSEHEDAVLRGELRATGHSDYSAKWALYCAETVLFINRALSPRELEVLRSIASGLDYRDTADTLGISMNTAKFHAVNARLKLGAGGSNAAAVAEAFRRGILQ